MEKLRETLTQEDVVIFVGSGVSLWSGLPTWSGLIDQLVAYVEQAGSDASLIRSEKGKGELLQAASYGFDLLTKQQIGEFIRSACNYGVAKPHDIHKKIVSFNARCYVTTNYDNLIELALREWQPNVFFPPPITNRQLTETANIVTARATNFVFKPHGDASDADSIVLTREQYRDLLPQGERYFALEALKTILATRPVVYFGFGLRDPDFLYLRDLLANTYKGGTRDHYAVMSDIEDAEVRYWRRNYGIHLVGYDTTELPNGQRDHRPLLDLLDSLATKPAEDLPVGSMSDDRLALLLVRHCARLGSYPKASSQFTIRVQKQERTRSTTRTFDKFDYCPVGMFLKEFPHRAILVGLPGAGKTYSLHMTAAEISEELHNSCISDELDVDSIVVPIVADMKLYSGSIRNLIDDTLPADLSVDELSGNVELRIFLDSFNEMPKEYWENEAYLEDLKSFLDSTGSASVFIGSRTTDGLERLNWPTYCLEQIDHDTVRGELAKTGCEYDAAYEPELLSLFSKPFFFKYVVDGKLGVPSTGNPRDFYDMFFTRIRSRFSERFSSNTDIQPALENCAYDALDRGEETFYVANLLSNLRHFRGDDEVKAEDIVNWLISEQVVVPFSGGRIAFVHQSLTEFLAAKKLADVYVADPMILQEKLSLYRWDQALFLTLSLLPADLEDGFIADVLRVDLELGLAAVKYLDHKREEVLAQLLEKVAERVPSLDQFGRIGWLIERNLPISEVHAPQLRKLIATGNVIGGAAAARLIRLRGEEVKVEMLDLLLEHQHDHNFCVNGVAPHLRELVVADDLDKIIQIIDSVAEDVTPESDEKVAQGLIGGVTSVIGSMPISLVREKFLPKAVTGKISEVRGRVLKEFARDQKTTEGLELAAELLLHGVPKASIAIYFIGKFNRDTEISWSVFETEHLDKLIETAYLSEDNEAWAIETIRLIIEFRSDFAAYVEDAAARYSGVLKAILRWTGSKNQVDAIFETLDELKRNAGEETRFAHCHLLEHIGLDWHGREELFIDLLRLRNPKFALALLNSFMIPDGASSIGELEIGEVNWWLDWLSEAKNFWLEDRLTDLFAGHLSDDKKGEFLQTFNTGKTEHLGLLKTMLPRILSDLSTDDLSADAISFLLADVSRNVPVNFRGHILGSIATEKLVEETLLPLANTKCTHALATVLKQAGKRHGRRYLAKINDSV